MAEAAEPLITETSTPPKTETSLWLSEIYHRALKSCPSPEAAKHLIKEAHRDRKLHLRGKQLEHKARPNLRLKPGDNPPPQAPDIVEDCLLPLVRFLWDWRRGRANYTDRETKSLFQYLDIYASADEVLKLLPVKVADAPPRDDKTPPATWGWNATYEYEQRWSNDIPATSTAESAAESSEAAPTDKVSEQASEQVPQSTKDWIKADIKCLLKEGEKIPDRITDFAKLLEERLADALEKDSSLGKGKPGVRAVGYRHIVNSLKTWGFWPPNAIK
jgi:hypothetical protein